MSTIRLPRGEWRLDLTQPLGPAGGFGEVFAGTGPDGASVAVKRLKLTADDTAHRELRIADHLITRRHKHIVPVFDAGQDADSNRYYIVMARADRSLQAEIASRGKFSHNDAVNILLQIANGLIEAADVVHRDLKPGNVLRHEGVWKLADFGIARFVEDSTSTNTLKGAMTPAYAAPEQWRAEHSTAATDVYALGCIAHVLLNGGPPFRGPTRADYQRQHLTMSPPALAVGDPRLVNVVVNMLRKAPEGRPTTSRVASVLSSVIRLPAPAVRPSLAALQRATASEATRQADAEAVRAAADAVAERRQRLADESVVVFVELMDQLANAAREASATVGLKDSAGRMAIGIGTALLSVRLPDASPAPVGMMPQSKWDAITLATIEVTQRTPLWSHGGTLWFMRLPNAAEYRWYEVSYKDHAFMLSTPRGPYAATDIGEADLAASPGVHTVEIASGPTAVDGEDADSFIDRWLSRLTDAFHGRLRPW